jgi:hypothetical protein
MERDEGKMRQILQVIVDVELAICRFKQAVFPPPIRSAHYSDERACLAIMDKVKVIT